MPYLDVFRLKFEETIAIFEISTAEFVTMQKFMQNKKLRIWDQKCLTWFFWAIISKTSCHILKSDITNFSKCKISSNNKTP